MRQKRESVWSSGISFLWVLMAIAGPLGQGASALAAPNAPVVTGIEVKMSKKVRLSLILFFSLCAITLASSAFGEISTEVGADTGCIIGIIKLYEPAVGGKFVGTLEWTLGGGMYRLFRKDVAGNVMYASLYMNNQIGGVQPIYDANGKISKFRCFVTSSVAYDNIRYCILYFNGNLTFNTAKPRFPADKTQVVWQYAGPMITYPDGSYMTIGYNTAGIYLCRFNADDTRSAGWPELKTLDMSMVSGGKASDIVNVKAALAPDGINVIIGATVKSEKGINLFFCSISKNGAHATKALADYNYIVEEGLFRGYRHSEYLVGIDRYKDHTYAVFQIKGVTCSNTLMVRLKMKGLAVVESTEYTSEFPFFVGCLSISPSGIMYVGGEIFKSGIYQSFIGSYYADDGQPFKGINIFNVQRKPGDTYGNFVRAITWAPSNQAIMGGQINGGTNIYPTAFKAVFKP